MQLPFGLGGIDGRFWNLHLAHVRWRGSLSFSGSGSVQVQDTGTYSVSGNSITVSLPGVGKSANGPWSLSANILRLPFQLFSNDAGSSLWSCIAAVSNSSSGGGSGAGGGGSHSSGGGSGLGEQNGNGGNNGKGSNGNSLSTTGNNNKNGNSPNGPTPPPNNPPPDNPPNNPPNSPPDNPPNNLRLIRPIIHRIALHLIRLQTSRRAGKIAQLRRMWAIGLGSAGGGRSAFDQATGMDILMKRTA